jgi:hypothetical protein
MKILQSNIFSVLAAMAIFLSFSMLHEFDWLIPPSPVTTVATTSAMPLPDIIEEYGSEDEIEHEDSVPLLLPNLIKSFKDYMVSGDLFSPSITTPPPDKA